MIWNSRVEVWVAMEREVGGVMRIESAIAFVLMLGGVTFAADPPSATTTPTKPAKVATTKPAPKPLDLRVGDVRNYMMPNDFKEAIQAPDPEKNTVVVEGERVLLPLKSQQPVPNQLIAPFWALANPLQAWRVFVPDPNRAPPGPPEVVPPPIFRWGP